MSNQKAKMGDVVAIVWKDHEKFSDINLKIAVCAEPLMFATWGKLVGENEDYWFIATSYESLENPNNDHLRILKKSTEGIKVIERSEL